MFDLIVKSQASNWNLLKSLESQILGNLDDIQNDIQTTKDCQSGYLSTEIGSLAMSACLTARLEELDRLYSMWLGMLENVQEDLKLLETRIDQTRGIANDLEFIKNN